MDINKLPHSQPLDEAMSEAVEQFRALHGGALPPDGQKPHESFKARLNRYYHDKHFWWIVMPTVVFMTAVYSLFFLHNPRIDAADRSAPTSARIIIPENATSRQIADSLEKAGILKSEITFRAAAKMVRAGHRSHGGTFKIERGLSNVQIIQRLLGDQYQIIYALTIPEGFRLKDVAQTAESNLDINDISVIEAASDPAFLHQIGLPPEARTAEGFLYPDSYKWLYPVDAKALVQALVTRFHQKVPDTLLKAAQTRGLTPYQVMTFASIVTGETKDSAERYTVAGVYENRYRIGMKLQADPTVQYGLQLDRPITHSDIMQPSEYNTYLNKGLPPGPINNPSVLSIRAAVYPQEHDYLFFVAKRDGSRTHYFSSTYEEHKQNIKKEVSNIAGAGKER